MLSEISQTEKDKFCTIFLIYGNLKKKTQNTDTRLVVSTGEGIQGGGQNGRKRSSIWLQMVDLWR